MDSEWAGGEESKLRVKDGEHGRIWPLTDGGLKYSEGWQPLQGFQPGDGTQLLSAVSNLFWQGDI